MPISFDLASRSKVELAIAFTGICLYQNRRIRRYLRIFQHPLLLSALAAYFYSSCGSNLFLEISDIASKNSSLRFSCDLFHNLILLSGLQSIHGLLTNLPSYSDIFDVAFGLFKDLPIISNAVKVAKEKLKSDVCINIKNRSYTSDHPILSIPPAGIKKSELLAQILSCANENESWRNGKVSGAVYHGGIDHQEALSEVFSIFSLSNALHPEVWPSITKFESEIVAMTISLMNGSTSNDSNKSKNICSTVCGCTTSGGTESIILAIKAHRDYYCKGIFGISSPEVVCCVSAHAAVDKACDLMKLKLIKVPMDPTTYQCDLHALVNAITPNTIMIYASAPSYSQGIIDPIPAMGAIAVRYGIGLHVDCCLGGFILPFAKKLGYAIPDFDFTVPGVTSMSADTHKYGYSLKGTSVVLYRTPELRHAQYFSYPHWTGGLYTTTTLAGSRPGGLIVQCWASMMLIGYQGYEENARLILETAKKIAVGVNAIPGLKTLGRTEAMVVCFGTNNINNDQKVDHCTTDNNNYGDSAQRLSPITNSNSSSSSSSNSNSNSTSNLNIYVISDMMSRRGWHLNALQSPPCIHLCCTLCHLHKEDMFLHDLAWAVSEAASLPPDVVTKGNAGIYGMTASLPNGPINELLNTYHDVLLDI